MLHTSSGFFTVSAAPVVPAASRAHWVLRQTCGRGFVFRSRSWWVKWMSRFFSWTMRLHMWQFVVREPQWVSCGVRDVTKEVESDGVLAASWGRMRWQKRQR